MSLRKWLITKLGGYTSDFHIAAMHTAAFAAYEKGKRQARIQLAVWPLQLPFTPDQLAGKEYGTFITPAGFAHTFGECNVPAPGPFGYEQRAGYIRKDGKLPLNLKVYGPDGSEGEVVYPSVPEDVRDYYTPVIVTVLR